MNPKSILIMTADAGHGHRRAAEAVEVALLDLYEGNCRVDVVNPLNEPGAPESLRQIEESYDDIVVEEPVLYKLAYHALNAPVVSDLAKATAAKLLEEATLRIVRRDAYDAIVSTYPLYAKPVARAVHRTGRDVPLAVVITDLTDVQRVWYSRSATFHFVPTDEIRQQAYQNKIPATRVRVTGLPMHPDFHRETRDQTELRRRWGWDLKKPTALIVVDNQAGTWAPGPAETLHAARSWLSGDPPQLEKKRANAVKLGKPRAAYEIAERVWGMA